MHSLTTLQLVIESIIHVSQERREKLKDSAKRAPDDITKGYLAGLEFGLESEGHSLDKVLKIVTQMSAQSENVAPGNVSAQ